MGVYVLIVEEKQKTRIFVVVVVGVRILMNVELFRVSVEMAEDV
jgi:hypothetical protein